MTENPDAPPPPPPTREEIAAWLSMAAALLVVFVFHLVPVLLAGFLTHMILRGMARRLRGERVSHGLARALSASLLGLAAAAIVTGAFLLFHGFVRGRLGDLPAVLESMGETLKTLRGSLGKLGLSIPLPGGDDVAQGGALWLREHAGELRHAGMIGIRGLAHALIGIVLGLLVFFRRRDPAGGPFSLALEERIRRFDTAFRSVAKAQIEISALNTGLSALYLFAGLPLFGVHLPQSGTLVLLTFVTGLVPVAGNLVSNTVILLVSLGISPWVAVASLGYLLVIHKLEYFLNAKIVGGHIGAAAWETLLAIVFFEAAFGIPGIVLAPVIYAYAKSELKGRGLL